MTTITLKQDGILTALKINGRVATYDGRIDEIKKVGSGRWEGQASGYAFEIIGGKGSGGASNEWFVKWDALDADRHFPVKSAVAAVNLINNS